MINRECYEKLDEIAGYKNGWGYYGKGHSFSGRLIERCRNMVGKMIPVPEIMPTIEEEICFQFDTDEFGIELAISNEEITGFVSDSADNTSFFVFGSDDEAVNFWNIIVGNLSVIA